ncbi:TetR/AcrR family transcriptional regulator [Streptacidiphilus pinicola]|uniref:TetR/AcrR family transcriptional regulator n=1 Tax=Streptacidiphilus pinicola TaxID=2219663 RepID=A0A2X0KAL7_9ACTN|nr:TetR/AcrR family transcriptional regulator [Streptacidiphilus pinicola]RAG84120.1 TetR/AcrR family transcriptional regulator [Streptacidiphilus pinicola]
MPRDTLSSDQIVEAAIALLDEEGLGGLNMRALGKRLGSAATAVYWHVGSKDNLITLAGDRVWSELTLPEAPAGPDGWRAAAEALAVGVHAMLTRHPWLVQAFGAHLMFGPAKARHDDYILALHENAGFTPAEADQASAALLTFVLGNALGPAAQAALTRKLAREGDGDAEARLAEGMAQAREVASVHPRLRARLEAESGTDYGAAPQDTFTFGLHALLDGLAARLATTRR